jgi:hypothetical protein
MELSSSDIIDLGAFASFSLSVALGPHEMKKRQSNVIRVVVFIMLLLMDYA